jgi:hypothetical protein
MVKLIITKLQLTSIILLVFCSLFLFSCKRRYYFEVINQTNHTINLYVSSSHILKRLQLLPSESSGKFEIKHRKSLIFTERSIDVVIESYIDTLSNTIKDISNRGIYDRELKKKSFKVIINENSSNPVYKFNFIID